MKPARRKAIRCERRRSKRRWKTFVRRQAQQRLVFFLLLAEITSSIGQGSSVRALWTKERSTHWSTHGWDHSSFTHQDWLMNFRLSKATFLYLREQLHSSISKSDSIKPYQQTSELPLHWATGADYRTISVCQSQVCVWLPSKFVRLLLSVCCLRTWRYNWSVENIESFMVFLHCSKSVVSLFF